jgi:hypothetical protein
MSATVGSEGAVRAEGIHYDPMREIDLMLLEDVMRHYPIEANTTVRWFQAGALVLVAAGVLGILAFDAARNDTVARAPTASPQTVLAP